MDELKVEQYRRHGFCGVYIDTNKDSKVSVVMINKQGVGLKRSEKDLIYIPKAVLEPVLRVAVLTKSSVMPKMSIPKSLFSGLTKAESDNFWSVCETGRRYKNVFTVFNGISRDCAIDSCEEWDKVANELDAQKTTDGELRNDLLEKNLLFALALGVPSNEGPVQVWREAKPGKDIIKSYTDEKNIMERQLETLLATPKNKKTSRIDFDML
jgi:hypothetical protein